MLALLLLCEMERDDYNVDNMYVIASSILAVIMASLAIFIRYKASKKPATARKIILPPLFMSTGALMFLHPLFRISWAQVVEALVVGAIFSIFLIKTSNFEIREGNIYLKRSKVFFFILIGLLLLRIILKFAAEQYFGDITYPELSGMFFILALGMIVPWRIAMYFSYKKVEKQKDLLEN